MRGRKLFAWRGHKFDTRLKRSREFSNVDADGYPVGYDQDRRQCQVRLDLDQLRSRAIPGANRRRPCLPGRPRSGLRRPQLLRRLQPRGRPGEDPPLPTGLSIEPAPGPAAYRPGNASRVPTFFSFQLSTPSFAYPGYRTGGRESSRSRSTIGSGRSSADWQASYRSTAFWRFIQKSGVV